MSEPGPFARRANERLWPLTRSQSTSGAAALAVALVWLFTPSRPLALLGLSALALASAVGPPGRSGVDLFVRAVAFTARTRWTRVESSDNDVTRTIHARGRREVVLYELDHRGRLDLTGADLALDDESAAMLERAANDASAQFVTWHVRSSPQRGELLLAVPASVQPSARWRLHDRGSSVTEDRLGHERSGWLYERWSHVRDEGGLCALFALSTSPSPRGVSVLEGLIEFSSSREAAVLVRVETAVRASARVGRQSHRWRANLSLAAAGGFRERSSFESATRTLREREEQIAAGRALCEVVVLVMLRASGRHELERAAGVLRADARKLGVRLERGNGRHAQWFCAALPGAPGWRSL